MKHTLNRNILLYVFIVLLPTIIGSYLVIQKQSEESFYSRKEEAMWIASIHVDHWDQFISETVTSLDMLSMAAESFELDLEDMQSILERAHKKDPRYGGLYLLNKNGMVITGSSVDFNGDYFSKEYVQEAIQTKDIIISNKNFTAISGQSVIGLAVPVLNENSELISLLIAHLRADYVENMMNVLTPDSKIVVVNSNDEVVMDFNTNGETEMNNGEWASIPINRLPWNVNVQVPSRDLNQTVTVVMFIIFAFLILTHIAFLFIKYTILKRKAQIEKKENEVQKLELVGTLAASTAHEIRNPLTGIKGLIQLLSEKYNHPNDQYYFSIINEEINRINEIVSEFLILGKPTAVKMSLQDLSMILNEVKPLISSEANLNHIKMTFQVPTIPVHVLCTKDQMKQVILNLTKNSIESMNNGGDLLIELKEKSHHCELIIKDNGVGISKKHMEKIFTPFYTSKETGTGLGLVVCKRILQSFGGEIRISSTENIGTTVVIKLPLAKQ